MENVPSSEQRTGVDERGNNELPQLELTSGWRKRHRKLSIFENPFPKISNFQPLNLPKPKREEVKRIFLPQKSLYGLSTFFQLKNLQKYSTQVLPLFFFRQKSLTKFSNPKNSNQRRREPSLFSPKFSLPHSV